MQAKPRKQRVKRERVGIAQGHILTRHRKKGAGDLERKKQEILDAAEQLDSSSERNYGR